MSVRPSRWAKEEREDEEARRERKKARVDGEKDAGKKVGSTPEYTSASGHAVAVAMAAAARRGDGGVKKESVPRKGSSGSMRDDDRGGRFTEEDDVQKLFEEFQEEEEKEGGKEKDGDESEKKDDVVSKSRNFVPSGKLKEDAALKYKGRVLMFDEPEDAVIPVFKSDGRWRIYIFKGKERIGEPLILQGGSVFLLGRDREIVDIPLDHPTCSAQHAVLQYRLVETPDGGKVVKLYIMDLGSTNGTFLNGDKLKPRVYVEILEKDIVKFALSTRDYIFVKENPS